MQIKKNGEVQQLTSKHRKGKSTEIYTYRFVNQIPLREQEPALLVNWCDLTVRNSADNFEIFHNAFVTNHSLNMDNVADLTTVEIVDFWVKKIWEMTGKSDKNCLNLQVKQGVPTNIRPKDWRGRCTTFSCRRDFVLALHDALNKFYPNRYQNWLTQVETEYKRRTGNLL